MKHVITARACIIHQDKLLLVSNDGSYWYLPGGHQVPGESLAETVVREVYEETGFTVKCEDILTCSEFVDTELNTHKVELFFKATIVHSPKQAHWKDVDHSVTKAGFFSLSAMQEMDVRPAYVLKGEWREEHPSLRARYQGIESR
jgi:ADP-ribose pyrophosphatase YjhB (NUDIX family)